PRQHQLLGRSTTPFPFPGPPPMGILGAPAPSLNNPSSQTHSFSHAGSTSWRRPSFSSARKRARQDEAANRVMSSLDAKSVSTATAPGRQPTSLVWLLNLSKRIRSAAIAAATNVLVRLTPEQWQQIYAASFSCNLSDGQRLLQLASEVLLTAPVHLCCSAPELEDLSVIVNRSVTSFTNWPTALALFFPILDELEAGWNARLGHGCQVEMKPVHHSHIHQLLSDRFLPRIWALVERNSSKPSAILSLSSLLWLITREQGLIRSHSVQPRLLTALRSHLVPMLKLMCADPNSKSFNLLLTLLEFASAVCIRSSASPTRLAKSTTGSVRLGPVRSQTVTLGSGERSSLSHLTPRLSVSISRYSTQLIAKLISRLSVINNSPPDVIIDHVRSIRRVENLLIAMSVQRPLVRFTALRCLSDWDTIRTLWNLNTIALTSYPMLRTVNSRSFDWARLVTSPSFLPDDLFKPGLGNQRSQNGNLLLTNPPPVDAVDNLSRGQFLRPNRGELRNRPPGVSGNASGVSSGLIHAERSVHGELSPKHSLITHAEWQPVLFHWVDLMKRLVNDATANPFRFAVCWTLCSLEATRENAYLLGAHVQSVLLPHGMHIPQASVTHLPNPLALVFPPTGVGLERVLGLLHGFVPEVKAMGANQIRLNPCATDRASELAQLWNMVLQQPLITECQLLEKQQRSTSPVLVSEHNSSDSSQFVSETSSSDPFTRSICTQRPLLPHCKLLLGLLMGLEATWAGPQAPRISIPDAITYLTANEGRHAQGVFPVPWSMDVCVAQARRMAVDYAQRRVDCRSALFRLTKELLTLIGKLCCAQDYSSIASRIDVCPLPLPESFHFPFDRLLYCLTPRELAILLSDVRRNLRLRIAFDLLRQNHPDRPLALSDLAASPPPAPAFVTPGLLLALLQSHLVEPGVAELVGPLLRAMSMSQANARPGLSVESVTISANDNDETLVEEVDVDGELMVVVNK
ncbi:uncharacterized protein DEA37_0003932, partial [Paragonimus westermani]